MILIISYFIINNNIIYNIYMGDLINTDINKNLSLAYDDEFNHKYNRANKLNKEISVKDKIIDINENSSRHQNKNIKILKLVLLMTGLLALVVLFMAIGMFSKDFMMLICIIIIFGFIIKILILKFRKNINFTNQNSITNKEFAKARKTGMAPLPFNPPKCPVYCTEEDGAKVYPTNIKMNMTNDIKTDSSLNVWSYGDQPEALYYNPRIYKGKYKKDMVDYRTDSENGDLDQPKPWFPEITENVDSKEFIDQMTYHDCEYNIKKTGKVGPFNQPATFRSTIPCKYYPGYKETLTCIYDKSSDKCNKV
jgi:hypothetical protein